MPERDGIDLILEQWRRERSDLDTSPMGVIGRISRLSREIEQRLAPVYAEHGLDGGWFDVLAEAPARPAPARRCIVLGTNVRGHELQGRRSR